MSTTVLDVAERDRVWQSTLTGAQYRWHDDQWECRFTRSPEWHPVAPDSPHADVVRAYPNEEYVEVTP